MKKFIISYSKEGRNKYKYAFCSYLRRALYQKKKKRCYLNSIFNILFFFFKMKQFLNLFIYLVLALKRKNCYNLKQFKSIDGIKGVF